MALWGDERRNTQILAHAPLRENGQSDKFYKKNVNSSSEAAPQTAEM
jgi:hypothetical protein